MLCSTLLTERDLVALSFIGAGKALDCGLCNVVEAMRLTESFGPLDDGAASHWNGRL